MGMRGNGNVESHSRTSLNLKPSQGIVKARFLGYVMVKTTQSYGHWFESTPACDRQTETDMLPTAK